MLTALIVDTCRVAIAAFDDNRNSVGWQIYDKRDVYNFSISGVFIVDTDVIFYKINWTFIWSDNKEEKLY